MNIIRIYEKLYTFENRLALSVADISKGKSKKDKNSLYTYDRDSLVRVGIFAGRFNVIQRERDEKSSLFKIIRRLCAEIL